MVRSLYTIIACLVLFFPLAFQFENSIKAEKISVEKRGGVYYVPAEINESILLDFIIDTGAAEVTIPADVIMTLMRNGSIEPSDYLPGKTYILADGSEMESPRVLIRQLKIGRHTLTHIAASISDVKGPLLLGQNLLERLGPYTLNTKTRELVFDDKLVQHEGEIPDSGFKLSLLKENIEASDPKEIVELFFHSVTTKQFSISWRSLSRYSQNRIVEMVKEEENTLTSEMIRELFDENHFSVQSGFWMSYREASQIPYFLQEAVFSKIKQNESDAMILVKVGKHEMNFQVLKENGKWKMGLIETLEMKDKE